jgi:hypothetical protein
LTFADQDVQALNDKDQVDLLLKRIATFEAETKINRKSPKKEVKKRKRRAESPGMIVSSSEAEEIDPDDFGSSPQGRYRIDRFKVSSSRKKPPIPPDETPKRHPSGKVGRMLSFGDSDLTSFSEPKPSELKYRPSSKDLRAATQKLQQLNYYQREKLRKELSTELLALDAIDRSEAAQEVPESLRKGY